MIQSTDESGLKMWTCSCCGYVSKKTTNMYKHIERKHLFLALKCNFCQKEFSSRNDCNVHIKTYHNWFYYQEKMFLFYQKWSNWKRSLVLFGLAPIAVTLQKTNPTFMNMSSPAMLALMVTIVSYVIKVVLLEMHFVFTTFVITAIKIKLVSQLLFSSCICRCKFRDTEENV